MDKQTDIHLTAQRAYSNACRPQPASTLVNFHRILTIDSQSPGSYYHQATFSFQARNYSKAERCFKRATVMAPDFIDAYFDWAICLATQRKFKPAAVLLKKVIKMNPNDLEAWCELGTVFIDMFHYENALGCLETVLIKDPGFFRAYAPYGQALFYIGSFEKAMEAFERVLQVEPKDWITNNTMGLYFLINQHYEEAKDCFETVVNHNRAYTLSWINWSMVLLQEGKKEEAVEMFTKGMNLMNKKANPNGVKQLIESYTNTSKAFERMALMENDQEKLGLEKTIESIKWALELLQNMKEEQQQT